MTKLAKLVISPAVDCAVCSESNAMETPRGDTIDIGESSQLSRNNWIRRSSPPSELAAVIGTPTVDFAFLGQPQAMPIHSLGSAQRFCAAQAQDRRGRGATGGSVVSELTVAVPTKSLSSVRAVNRHGMISAARSLFQAVR